MTVQVLLFARLAELVGTRRRNLELRSGARARDVLATLASIAPGFEQLAPVVRVARNGHLVSLDNELADGDELALLPPVGGG
jgi:molybdopterin converting factor small subunit